MVNSASTLTFAIAHGLTDWWCWRMWHETEGIASWARDGLSCNLNGAQIATTSRYIFLMTSMIEFQTC